LTSRARVLSDRKKHRVVATLEGKTREKTVTLTKQQQEVAIFF